MRTIAALTGSILIAGCASPPPTMLTASFDDAEMAACKGSGTEKIIGQAFLRTTIGEVRYAAGSFVVAYPGTAYTREVADIIVNGVPVATVPALNAYALTTQADGDGEFGFSGLMPCSYIVLTEVHWQIPVGYSYSRQGGILAKEVSVADGQTVKVILTR